MVDGVSHKDGGLTTAFRSPKSRVLLQSFIQGRSVRLENAYTAFSLSYNYHKTCFQVKKKVPSKAILHRYAVPSR